MSRLQGQGVSLTVDDVTSRNAALVVVRATLPPDYRAGGVDTEWLDRFVAAESGSREYAVEALVVVECRCPTINVLGSFHALSRLLRRAAP